LSLTLLLLPPLLLNIWYGFSGPLRQRRQEVRSSLSCSAPPTAVSSGPASSSGRLDGSAAAADPFDEFARSRAGLTAGVLTGDNGPESAGCSGECRDIRDCARHWRRTRRDKRLDRPDPYRELATRPTTDLFGPSWAMRNRMVAMHASMTSAIRRVLRGRPVGDRGANSTNQPAAPTSGPEMNTQPACASLPTPLAPRDHRCKANGHVLLQGLRVSGGTAAAASMGANCACVGTMLTARPYPGDRPVHASQGADLHMRRAGPPAGCKDKKPCIDVISSSLFKLPFINNKTVKLKKRERTTRQKIYDALQKAFNT
uniref:BHLH domain-containing protein n=1 Tax=Macrostomum lignano TaxID=282301 RepID=A0A1I8FN89_9PLAT